MLLDSNINIYTYKGIYPAIDQLIKNNRISFSEISYLETIGYPKITPSEENYLRHLFSLTTILPVDSTVIKQATALRKLRKMSLGDSIIAATAFIHDLTLATRNTEDFVWISNLKLVNPFES